MDTEQEEKMYIRLPKKFLTCTESVSVKKASIPDSDDLEESVSMSRGAFPLNYCMLPQTIIYFARTIVGKQRYLHEDHDVCPFGYLPSVMPSQGSTGLVRVNW